MASRGRGGRRETEDEDEPVMLDTGGGPQHIVLSDDEDDVSPLRVPFPQQPPAARDPVEEILKSRGLRPRTQWLEACLNQLSASQIGFQRMPMDRQAELCFEQFLVADFNVTGAALLPPSIHTLHNTELAGPFVLQVDEITNISIPLKDRYYEKAAGPGRTLKLSMTDGVQRVYGMEYRPIEALKVLSPAGMKVSLKNVCIQRGLLMLVPEVLDVLGGVVDDLEAARVRAVQLINKPPRGRRVPRGATEPSLVDRATRAAWPDHPAEVPAANLEGSHPQQYRHHTGTDGPSNGASIPSAHQSMEQGEHFPGLPQDQAAEPRRPSRHVTNVSLSTRLETIQREGQHEHMQQDQIGESSRETVSVSGKLNSARVQTIQQRQGQHLQQDCVEDCSVQSVRVSVLHQSAIEAVQQAEQLSPVEHDDHGAETSLQSIRVSCGHQSARGEVQQSSQIPSQSHGKPLLSPTLGRLSLRNRRPTQSNVTNYTHVQPIQLADAPHPSIGAEPERPVEIINSQETEQGTREGSSFQLPEIDNVPFTYLALLKEKKKARTGKHVVCGRVQCVIAGVGKFEYKDCDQFKLLLHIEDGSFITEAFVEHQVVQKLIGFSPMEVSLGLANPDEQKEMLNNMIRFQKFLERYEGLMDVEFRGSSPLPTIVQVMEGIPHKDGKLLLERVLRNAKRTSPPGHIQTIDLDSPSG